MQQDKVLIPADHSALQPAEGIAWLELLPVELQDCIASFLVFKNEEKEADFIERIKKYCSQVHIYNRTPNTLNLKDSYIKITKNGEVLKKFNPRQIPIGTNGRRNPPMHILVANYITEYSQEEYLYKIDKNNPDAITQIAAAANQKYLVALTKNSVATGSNVDAVYLIDLQTNQLQRILLPENLQPAAMTVYCIKDLIAWINQGYSYTASGVEKDQVYYHLENPIGCLAVSSDGKKIAYSNNNTVHVIEQVEGNIWKPKVITEKLSQEVNDLPVIQGGPDFWKWPAKAVIDFNWQGTHIGLGYNDNKVPIIAEKIIVHSVGKPAHKSLRNYFRINLICRQLKAANCS